MWIYKIMYYSFHIQECSGSFITPKSATHNLNAGFYIAIVPFNSIIVMLQSILAASNWHTKPEPCDSGKQIAPCSFIIPKFVTYKGDQFSFLFWFAFFMLVYFLFLFVTCL